MATAALFIATAALFISAWSLGTARTTAIVRHALPRPYDQWTPRERAAAQRLERHPLRWPA